MMNAAGFVIIPLTEQDIGTWVRQSRLYPICKEAEAGLKIINIQIMIIQRRLYPYFSGSCKVEIYRRLSGPKSESRDGL